MFKNLSIKSKLLTVYIIITGLVLASAFAIIMSINIKSSKLNIISGLKVVGEIVADRCAAPLAFSDVESANSNLRALSSHTSIVYACIRTMDNEEFSEYNVDVEEVFRCDDYDVNKSTKIIDELVDIYRPILLEGQPIGSLQIKASLSELTERIVRSIEISLFVFVSLMMLAVLVSGRVMNLITEPITKLKDIAQEVTNNQDYSLRAKESSNDEIGVLVGSFNNMLDQIQERDNSLIKEKEKAETSAESAKKYASETEKMNLELEIEIRERTRIEDELSDLNETLEDKVIERTAELKELNEKIGDVARSAGMAEVASGVLHNVGNVLNSVNVSASLIREQVRKSKVDNLSRVVKMLDENSEDIAAFISKDEKGKQIPKFLHLLSEQLGSEKELMYKELDDLSKSIDHIKNVISMQQSYAGSVGVREKISLSELVEDALKINMQGMQRHGIEVVKEFHKTPMLYLDKHKALQIVINLISNAKNALVDCEKKYREKEKVLTIVILKENDSVSIEVKDTGIGIEAEDIKHLFEYGFKKRREGHGYGLHHSAIVANELGGKITVKSDGLGKGASFKLLIPIEGNLEYE